MPNSWSTSRVVPGHSVRPIPGGLVLPRSRKPVRRSRERPRDLPHQQRHRLPPMTRQVIGSASREATLGAARSRAPSIGPTARVGNTWSSGPLVLDPCLSAKWPSTSTRGVQVRAQTERGRKRPPEFHREGASVGAGRERRRASTAMVRPQVRCARRLAAASIRDEHGLGPQWPLSLRRATRVDHAPSIAP